MMKKLLLLWVVLAFCSSVMAAGHVELRIAPEDVNLGGYQASETITIQIYAAGFYEDYPNDTIGTMDIAAVLTDSNGTASAPSLHSTLAYGVGASPGDVINVGVVLIEDIKGYKEALDLVGVYPFPAVLWECEFHIPDAPLSSIITISLDGLSLKNIGYNDPVPAYTVGEPLGIQMACCPGDTDSDGDIDIDDFSEIRGKLMMAQWYDWDDELKIAPDDPCDKISVLWNPCLDCYPWGVGDGVVDIDDYSEIRGKLMQAQWYDWDNELLITPDDPCDTIRALWPCN